MLKSEACEIKSERSSATSAPSGAVSTLPGSAKLSVGESNGIEYGTHAGEDAFPPPFSSTCKEESPCVSVPALVSAPTVDSLHAEIQSLELLTHLRTAARRWALYHDNFFFHWDRLCFEWKVRRKRQAATGVQEDSQSTPCEPGVVKNRDSLDQQEEKRGENFQDSVDIFCQCLSVLLQQLDARRRCLDPAYLPFNRYLSIPTVTPFSLSRTRSLSRQDSWRTFSIEAFSSPELDSHCNSSLSGAIGGCGGQGGLKGSPRSQEHQAFQNPQASPWTSDALGSSKTSSEGFKEAHLDKSLPHPHDSLPLSASPAAAAATKALRAAASALSNSRWCAPNCSKVRDGPCSCTSCGEEEGKEAHCGLSSSLQQEVSRDLFRGPFCGRPASRSKHGADVTPLEGLQSRIVCGWCDRCSSSSGKRSSQRTVGFTGGCPANHFLASGSLLGPVLLDTGGHSRPSHHTFMNGASTPGSSPGVGAPADAGPADAVTFQRRSNDGSMPSQKKEEEAEALLVRTPGVPPPAPGISMLRCACRRTVTKENPGPLRVPQMNSLLCDPAYSDAALEPPMSLNEVSISPYDEDLDTSNPSTSLKHKYEGLYKPNEQQQYQQQQQPHAAHEGDTRKAWEGRKLLATEHGAQSPSCWRGTPGVPRTEDRSSHAEGFCVEEATHGSASEEVLPFPQQHSASGFSGVSTGVCPSICRFCLAACRALWVCFCPPCTGALDTSMVVDSTEAEQLATYIPSSAPSSLVRCNVGGEGAAPKAVRKSSHIVVEDAGMRLSFVARKGVYYDKRRRLWRANWKENGRIHTKGFSVHDYLSHEAARQKAIEFRERKEQEIELYQQIRSPRTFTDEDWNFKPQTGETRGLDDRWYGGGVGPELIRGLVTFAASVFESWCKSAFFSNFWDLGRAAPTLKGSTEFPQYSASVFGRRRDVAATYAQQHVTYGAAGTKAVTASEGSFWIVVAYCALYDESSLRPSMAAA
ncbi:uncharacterized protein LOC34617278 [Cyclospora cayetanensis]|uniref:Uncharacterized protein LOC34617278 n=1 Tax=Cyclospora cayetanensis TaxID=88456 RepID=A0A6P6RYV8_9EIME|nr:uncharacterized protein LOC34617278 [Cyclospora cayetanensis]